MHPTADFHPGLEGVVAARTALSDVDGEAGRLIIAGADVEGLAGQVSFEAVVARLWGVDARGLEGALADGRAKATQRLATSATLDAADPMDALRAAVAALPSDTSPAELTAHVGVAAAAWAARRRGGTPPTAGPDGGHAAALLSAATGQTDAARARALDAYLVTVVDHGLNASTFTARVIASTQADLVSCVVGALGALKGPLHGGAPGPVLDMLDAIGEPGRAAAWLGDELAAGRRIMGMGHRVYRVRDPRAAVLERAVEALERAGVRSARLRLARAVEQAAKAELAKRYPQRSLDTNVEFYTAVLLDTVGLGRELFTPLFAAARVAGWCAHVAEERRVGRLIRPASQYVGPVPARADAGA